MSTAGCHHCGQPGALGWRYALPAASAEGARIDHCLRCATRHPALVGRASRVALVVGTVLTAINQGNAIVGGHATAELLWKIPLTYLVPYLVSTYSTLGAVRTRPEATIVPLGRGTDAGSGGDDGR